MKNASGSWITASLLVLLNHLFHPDAPNPARLPARKEESSFQIVLLRIFKSLEVWPTFTLKKWYSQLFLQKKIKVALNLWTYIPPIFCFFKGSFTSFQLRSVWVSIFLKQENTAKEPELFAEKDRVAASKCLEVTVEGGLYLVALVSQGKN